VAAPGWSQQRRLENQAHAQHAGADGRTTRATRTCKPTALTRDAFAHHGANSRPAGIAPTVLRRHIYPCTPRVFSLHESQQLLARFSSLALHKCNRAPAFPCSPDPLLCLFVLARMPRACTSHRWGPRACKRSAHSRCHSRGGATRI
jgi:hypothetical protein